MVDDSSVIDNLHHMGGYLWEEGTILLSLGACHFFDAVNSHLGFWKQTNETSSRFAKARLLFTPCNDLDP